MCDIIRCVRMCKHVYVQCAHISVHVVGMGIWNQGQI